MSFKAIQIMPLSKKIRRELVELLENLQQMKLINRDNDSNRESLKERQYLKLKSID